MLRVGLTGNLGSGKSTAATLFHAHGAHVVSSDTIGRDLMRPGHAVFDQILEHFGSEVLEPGGTLDRAKLGHLAFVDGRAEELNAIVHPAVIARQASLAEALFSRDLHAIFLVESALLFETRHGPADWHSRFDCIILVTAPESAKIARFVHRQHQGEPSDGERDMLEAEARRRLALQIPDKHKASQCDYVLANDGSMDHLRAQVDTLWPLLLAASNRNTGTDEIRRESLQ